MLFWLVALPYVIIQPLSDLFILYFTLRCIDNEFILHILIGEDVKTMFPEN